MRPLKRGWACSSAGLAVAALVAGCAVLAAQSAPQRETVSGAAARLLYPRMNGMSVSPDGKRLAFRVAQHSPGSGARSEALWCTALDRPGAPQGVAEGRIEDFSWSADSRRLLVVKWTGSGSSVWISGLSRRSGSREVYSSSMLIPYARWCHYAPRWIAVLVVETSAGSVHPVPSFRLAVVDVEDGAEVASCTMDHHPSGAGWLGREPRLVFPFRHRREDRRIGIITLGPGGARRDTIATAMPVLRVYGGVSERGVYYSHPVTKGAAGADEESLSVIDAATKAEKVVVPVFKYKQLSVSPDGGRVVYVGPLRRLHVVRAASGEDRVIARGVDALVRGGSWTTGNRIVFRAGKRLYSAAPDGSERRLVADLESLAKSVGARGYIGQE